MKSNCSKGKGTKAQKTPAQKKALKRNWSKGIITSMLKHTNQMKNSKALTFAEQMKLLKCKVVFEEILDDWKPTI